MIWKIVTGVTLGILLAAAILGIVLHIAHNQESNDQQVTDHSRCLEGKIMGTVSQSTVC